MKVFIKTLAIAFVFVLGVSQQANAQKAGHLNSMELISLMPATKTADSQLETYSKQLSNQLETKGKKLQDDYVAFMKDVQAGGKTPLQQQQKGEEFEKRRQAILKEEQAAQVKVMQKRQEVYQPIIDKINAAISAVGEEGGYDYIFDLSAGATIVYFKASEDVTAKVKAKLGL